MEPEGLGDNHNVGRLVRCENALPERLDVSLPATRDWLLLSNALMVRFGVLQPEELCCPERFAPAVLVSGASYSGKTTTMRVLRDLVSCPGRRDRELVSTFRRQLRLIRAAADTSRPIRRSVGARLNERQGDPYWFRSPSVMYAWIREDQIRFERRLAGDHSPATLRRYLLWAYFVDNFYAGVRRRFMKLAGRQNSAWVYDGSQDQIEVLLALFLAAEAIYMHSSWYGQLNTRVLEDPNSMVTAMIQLLATYREQQTEREQQIRLLAGYLVTGYVQEHMLHSRGVSDRCPVDYIFEVSEGIESNRNLARSILEILLAQLSPERQRMLGDVQRYLRQHAREIEQFAFSKEIAGLSVSGLPKFIGGSISASDYRFGSALTQPEPMVPLPPQANQVINKPPMP